MAGTNLAVFKNETDSIMIGRIAGHHSQPSRLNKWGKDAKSPQKGGDLLVPPKKDCGS
jgi:hypothetical protein